MRDKIRFTLSSLMWAVVMLAAYTAAAHGQTGVTSHEDRIAQKKSGAAVILSGPPANTIFSVTVSGYLVDLP